MFMKKYMVLNIEMGLFELFLTYSKWRRFKLIFRLLPNTIFPTEVFYYYVVCQRKQLEYTVNMWCITRPSFICFRPISHFLSNLYEQIHLFWQSNLITRSCSEWNVNELRKQLKCQREWLNYMWIIH